MSLLTLPTLLATARREADAVSLDLSADWLQGRTAYGGWQAMLALLAMRQVAGAAPLRSLQANFIAPVPPGPVTARAELLRRGKSAAQVEARIRVDGTVAFTALGIFGAERASRINHAAAPPLAVAAPETLSDLPYLPGVTPAFQQHFRMRWARGQPPFSAAADGSATIWVRFCDPPADPETALVCLADAIPPSAIAMYDAPAPVSSMNWTLEIIRLPDAGELGGWWRFDAELSAASAGYGWQTVSMWSPGGRLAALSRQCVALFA